MASLTEDSDEDYIDDPITLIDCEQKRINITNNTLTQEIIELSDSDVDVVPFSPPQPVKSAKHPKLARASCKIVSSTLPVAFFQIPRNIELLNKCLPLRIKIVDCDKNSWYYRRKYKNIKIKEFSLAVDKIRDKNNKNKKKCRNSVEGSVDGETMKPKIRPVDVEPYLKSPICDMKTSLSRQKNDKTRSDENKEQLQNIDLKKNQGLVGLKIMYDVNIRNSNPILEENNQFNVAEIPKCDSQNREHKSSIRTNRPPEKHRKKRVIKESSPLISVSESVHLKKNNDKEKSCISNSDSLKLTKSSKVVEENQYNKKNSSQTHVLVASKIVITKKKSSDHKTKPKTSGQKQKLLKKTKEVTENITAQKKEINEIFSKIDRMAEKESKSNVQTLDIKDNVSNDENGLKMNFEYNVPVSIISKNKVKLGKHKITKTLQQTIDERCKQQQDNLKSKIAVGQTIDIKDSVAKNENGLKMNAVHNLPVSITAKDKVKLLENNETKPLPQNVESRCEQPQNNPQKFEIGYQNLGKSQPKQLPFASVITSNNKGKNINIFINNKTGSKFASLNENNTDNNMGKYTSHIRSHLPLNCNTGNKIENNSSHIRSQMIPKVANSQSNDKSVLTLPGLSKQQKSCEFQQKQELSIQHVTLGTSEHLHNKQVLAPMKKVVIYPVFPKNVISENSRTTSRPAAHEKRENNGLPNSISAVPTSTNEMLPNPSQIRYQIISPNVSMPKVLSSSFSQSFQNKTVSSQPPNAITQNILNHARIILKRPKSEPVSNSGQKLQEKQNGNYTIAPNKTLSLIPTLTSTQKGHYIVINKKFINNKQFVHEQNSNSLSYNFEQHQQHTLPNQHNKANQNQTSSQYLVKNNPAPKEYSTNKHTSPNQHNNAIQNQTSSQYPLKNNPAPREYSMNKHTSPNQHNNAIQNQTSSQYPLKNNPAPKEYSTNKHTSPNQHNNAIQNQTSSQYPLKNNPAPKEYSTNKHTSPNQHNNAIQNQTSSQYTVKNNPVPKEYSTNKHTSPNQHNKAIQNQTSSQYHLKNNPAPKEYSTNKRQVSIRPAVPNLYSKRLKNNKQKLLQYPNPQPQPPVVSTHNYSTFQAPLPPPPSNLYCVQNTQLNTNHQSNEYAQYYNDHSQLKTNLVPLSTQSPQLNEYGYYSNIDALLKTVHSPLPSRQLKPNKHESYSKRSIHQALADQQQKPNENKPCASQKTILNLDKNTLMHPPPLNDYVPQNMNDMDCAYWNDINYLGDEWQQGYPQQPVLAEPQYLQQYPDFQHPPSLPVYQCPPGPSDFQHPPLLQVSQYPPGPSDFQHQKPLPVSEYPPGLPDFQYPPPPTAPQHPLTPSITLQSLPLTASHYPQPLSLPGQSLPPPVAHHPMSPAALHYPPLTPDTHYAPLVSQHTPPPLPHPHPPNPLPTTSTQGSTILGANNNGVVRTINLVSSNTTVSKLATSNNSLIDENYIPVNSKLEMLKELSKIDEPKSPNLKRYKSDSHSEFTNVKPISGPLAKVRKLEDFASDPSSTQKSVNNGYSPPILPIPTYEKTLEYIAQVSSSKEKASDDIDAMVEKYDVKKLEGILKKNSDLGEIIDRAKTVKKISVLEYINRCNNIKEEGNVVKSESKFFDPDLGYDSDSTVILA